MYVRDGTAQVWKLQKYPETKRHRSHCEKRKPVDAPIRSFTGNWGKLICHSGACISLIFFLSLNLVLSQNKISELCRPVCLVHCLKFGTYLPPLIWSKSRHFFHPHTTHVIPNYLPLIGKSQLVRAHIFVFRWVMHRRGSRICTYMYYELPYIYADNSRQCMHTALVNPHRRRTASFLNFFDFLNATW